MVGLFGADRTVINRHVRNTYSTAELSEEATHAKNAQVQREGGRKGCRIQPDRGVRPSSVVADWLLYSGSFLFDVARASWLGPDMSQPQGRDLEGAPPMA